MFKAICAILAFLNSNALFQLSAQSGCYPSRGIQTARGLQYHIYIHTYINITGLCFVLCFCFFPTCQVRVVRFYVSWPPPPSSPPPPPDLNCKLAIAVVSAGPNSKSRIRMVPQLQACDRSGPHRTRVVPAGPQLVPAGPEQHAPDQSVPRRSKPRIRVVPAGPELQDQSGPRRPQPQRISEDILDRTWERMSEDMPHRMPERMPIRIYARRYVRIHAR